MTGNAKATWMRYTLTVKNDDIRRYVELGEGLQQGRCFTEG